MKKVLFLMLLLVIGLGVMAQQRTQIAKPQWTSISSVSPEAFQTQLISSTENSIKVNVQVPGFYTTTVTTPQGEAYVITVPKAVSTAHVGEPDVPMTGIPIMIGDKARMAARVIDAQYIDYENMEVAPSKGDFPRSIDPATVPYTYGECYSQDAFFPASNVGLYEPYIIRDFRGQNIVVYPFAYNPVTKTLRVYYNMTVEMYKVDDQGTNVIATRHRSTVKLDPDFKSLYQRHFINYEESSAKYTALDEEGDLLIICYDNFISSMTDFVNWKKTRGVNTTIVGTSTAGSSYSAIKTYIQNQYNANNNLTHVLLVGDVAQIPGYSYSGGGSSYSGLGDNAYGQIVGNDIYNDVFIGRFSASSASRVVTQCNRAITYERDLTSSASWLQKGVGISRKENGSGHNSEDDYQHIDNIRSDLLNYGYTSVTQRYANLTGYDGSSSTISSDINSGAGIVVYANHGQETAWGANSSGYIYYSTSHVNALTNENKLPFIWSVACLVGKYDHDSDCFAEAWMNATNNNNPTGAIGTLMSYISQPWIPPMWAQDECIDILTEQSSTAGTKHTWGGTSINGLMGIFDHYSTSESSAVGTYQAWILYGDPSLVLRTKTPQDMTVNHNGNITIGASTYTVNVSNGNGAVATITDANHNILGKATVSNGTATISLNSTNLTVGTELTLCVFGYNKVTYLGTINVVGGTQYNITVTQPQHGTISAPAQAYANTTVTLTANPETGYCLSSWTVKKGSTNITVTNNQFTMPEGNVTVTATFVQGLQVTLASVEHGSISADPTCALQGTTINLTATPATGYVFDSWVVYKTGDVTTTVNVSGNSFTMPSYDVTVVGIFLVPAGGDVTIGSGTSSSNYLPTGDYYNYSLTQQIYTASELGTAGTITAISFYYNTSTASKERSLKVYMSHTANSTITAWSQVSASQLVFSGTHTFNQGWNTITLTTPFEYNGTSNLLLTVDDNTGSWGTNSQFYSYASGAQTAIYYRNDNTNPDPTGSVSVTANTLTANAQMKVTKEVPSTDGFLSVSPTGLTGFEATSGTMASTPQSVAVIGVNLQENLTVTAPDGYEVSTTSGGTYNSTLTLTPSNGSIQANVFVRLSSGVGAGIYSGNMTLVSGTTSATVSVSGTVAQGTGTSYYITVTANPAAGGTVTGAGSYEYGATATLTATANEGYTFTGWEKGNTVVSTDATYSFTVTEFATLVANFTLNSYEVNVTANPEEGGTVTIVTEIPEIPEVTEGTGDTLTYNFEDGAQGWTVLKGNTGNSPNNWMHNTSYSTSNNNFTTGYGHNGSDGFMLSESYISGSSSGTGTPVTPDNYLVSPQVTLGGSISFYAGARNTSYCAEKFSVMVSTTDNTNTASFTTVETWTLSLSQAGYAPDSFNVDLSAYSGMGYIAIRHYDCYDQWFLCIDNVTIVEGATAGGDTPGPNSNVTNATFNHGEYCTVTAAPADGYTFTNWTMGDAIVSTSTSYTFPVTSDMDLVANFITIGTLTVNVASNNDEYGTVSGGGEFLYGETCTVTATPAEGYSFMNWTKNGEVVSESPDYTFEVTGNVSLVANFVVKYTVNVVANNDEYGTVSGGGEFSYGETCTVTATPAEGYMFTNWTINGEIISTDASYTFTVDSNMALVANFAEGNMIGDDGDATNNYLPTYNYYKYSLTEQIYTSAELGSAGLITGIAFYNGGAAKTRTLDFYMKNTTQSSFSGNTDWVAVSASDKVFSGSVTFAADDWTTVTFNTPFVYDGTSNVVLVTDDNSNAYTNSPHMACRVFDAVSQALYVYSDNTNYNPSSPSSYSGTVLSVKNQIIITKEAISTEPVNITASVSPAQAGTVSGGGEIAFGELCTVSVTPNEGYIFTGWTENGAVVSSDLEFSFTATSDKDLVATFVQGVEIGEFSANNAYLPSYNFFNYSLTQQIYTADEIGEAGTINWIAFYNEGNEKTRTYDLYLKATDKTSFSSNDDWITVDESDKVFTGSVTMTEGSWTIINFTTPFEYDGISNLVLVADDNTGEYSNSPHMTCSVFNTEGAQAVYIYNDNTDFDPMSPPEAATTNDVLSVKNHILMGITASGNPHHTITASANPTEGGTISGDGTFEEGETCTLTATANTGYNFTNWTQNGTQVSTEATYTFTVTASGAYVANFSQTPVCSLELDSVENFENYTDTTARWTDAFPGCWTVAHHYTAVDPDTVAMIYYKPAFASDGSYSLRLHHRGIVAMPALPDSVDFSRLQLNMNVRQSKSYYKLEVGVMTDLDGDESFVPVALCDNETTEVIGFKCNFASYTAPSDYTGPFYIAFRNIGTSATDPHSVNYLDEVELSYVEEEIVPTCAITELDHSEDFEEVEIADDGRLVPPCWTLPDAYSNIPAKYKPQLYKGFATNGIYSLRLRDLCTYVMPEYAVENTPIQNVKMTFSLRQPNKNYRLEVGVMTDANDTSTFVLVKRINNRSTGIVPVEVSFANYVAPEDAEGLYIAFRNVGYSAAWTYSYNYIDSLRIFEVADEDDNAKFTEAEGDNAFDVDRYLENITVYPNPTTGNLHIDAMDIQKVEVFNQMGQLVGVYGSEPTINLGHLAQGIYMVHITVPQGTTVRKVVKR